MHGQRRQHELEKPRDPEPQRKPGGPADGREQRRFAEEEREDRASRGADRAQQADLPGAFRPWTRWLAKCPRRTSRKVSSIY